MLGPRDWLQGGMGPGALASILVVLAEVELIKSCVNRWIYMVNHGELFFNRHVEVL